MELDWNALPKKKIIGISALTVLLMLLFSGYLIRSRLPVVRVQKGMKALMQEIESVSGKENIAFSLNASGPAVFEKMTIGLDGELHRDIARQKVDLHFDTSIMNLALFPVNLYIDGEEGYIQLPKFSDSNFQCNTAKIGEVYNNSVLSEYTGISLPRNFAIDPYHSLQEYFQHYWNENVKIAVEASGVSKQITMADNKSASCREYLVRSSTADKTVEFSLFLSKDNQIREIQMENEISFDILLLGSEQTIENIQICRAAMEIWHMGTLKLTGTASVMALSDTYDREALKKEMDCGNRISLEKIGETDLFQKITAWEQKYDFIH